MRPDIPVRFYSRGNQSRVPKSIAPDTDGWLQVDPMKRRDQEIEVFGVSSANEIVILPIEPARIESC